MRWRYGLAVPPAIRPQGWRTIDDSVEGREDDFIAAPWLSDPVGATADGSGDFPYAQTMVVERDDPQTSSSLRVNGSPARRAAETIHRSKDAPARPWPPSDGPNVPLPGRRPTTASTPQRHCPISVPQAPSRPRQQHSRSHMPHGINMHMSNPTE
jgi:hypothetical protein